MKVLFVQKQLFTCSGIMALSGFLKKNKHECRVFIDSVMTRQEMVEKIKAFKPDIIGFTLMSMEHVWFLERARLLKEHFPGIPIIAGGVHAILYAEELINVADLDFVCRGEGEIAMLQILEYLESKTALEDVSGILYKKNGTIQQTELQQSIDLNEVTEDRDIYYDDYAVLKTLPLKIFFSSRGCPFRCRFCVNGHLLDKFQGTGNYIRRKSVEYFISEISHAKDRYGIKSIYFADDLFVWDKKWLKDFCREYQKIKVPFLATCYANRLDEEIVQDLAAAGCHTVTFGVETGNEDLRNQILGKRVTDFQLLRSAKLLKKYGIRIQTSNMFCLPSETVEDAIKTIDLNIKMEASFSMCAIFMPFPKTPLADQCIEMGILKPDYGFRDIPTSFVTHSVLKIKNRDIIERLQKVAGLIIQYPWTRNALINFARYIKSDAVAFFLYLLSQVLRFRIERKLTLRETLSYLWTYRKSV